MNPELIKLLIQVGLNAYAQVQALKTTDPVAFEAALQQVGDDHRKALDRLEAAVAP